MKAHPVWIGLILIFVSLSAAHAQEYGKIRALNQRAAQVIQQRNDFVSQVLTSYGIPHERNDQGFVMRIQMDGQWLAVSAVDIVPVMRESPEKRRQITAHELLFYTAQGILYLTSEMTAH